MKEQIDRYEVQQMNIMYLLNNYDKLKKENQEQINIVLEQQITFEERAHTYASQFRTLKEKWYSKEKIQKLLFAN